jgi:A/G-specific adenine glycosylase
MASWRSGRSAGRTITYFRRAAIEVVARHGGEVPRDYDALIALPGIGRYMAGAILSIAFNQPRPIVDGNVRRVVSRFNGWKDPAEPAIWDEAARLVGEGAPRMVNQGLMELGATVCTVRAPRCGVCPWKPECVAARDGTPDEIPVPRKRPATVRVDLCAVIDRNAHGVLMKGNDGLWEFPMLGSLPEGEFEKVGHCRHAITHHRIEVDVYRGRLPNRRGYRRVRPESLPMTSLTRKVYRAAQGEP